MRTFLIPSIGLLFLSLCTCEKKQEPDRTDFYFTEHFEWHLTSLDADNVAEMANVLENEYARIVADFGVVDMPVVKIHLYASSEELYQAFFDEVPNLPTWATGLVTGEADVHIVSPNSAQFSSTEFDTRVINIVHEFVHCVTLHIRPNFANNPRWLWESVAIYEANQFINPNSIGYMVQEHPPTLDELNSFSNTKVYDVGFTVAEYIVDHWDQNTLVQLILSSGDVPSVLGVTTDEFQTNWFEFVKNKYM